jgi:predicted dehydrogenase
MLTEKPPGKNSSDTTELCAAARKTGTPNLVAFNRRFMPVMSTGQKVIADSGLAIRSIHYDLCRVGRNDNDFSDTAIHAIDAVRFLCDADYEEVHFTRQKVPEKKPENVFMEAVMSKGILAHLQIRPNSGVSWERAVVHCDKYSFYFGLSTNDAAIDGSGVFMEYADSRIVQQISGSELCGSEEKYMVNGFYAENEHFLNALRTGSLGKNSLENALNTMQVKDAYASGAAVWRSK